MLLTRPQVEVAGSRAMARKSETIPDVHGAELSRRQEESREVPAGTGSCEVGSRSGEPVICDWAAEMQTSGGGGTESSSPVLPIPEGALICAGGLARNDCRSLTGQSGQVGTTVWESRAGSKDGCVGPCRIEADATGRGCRSREWQHCPFPGHGVTGYDFICVSHGLPANGQDEDSGLAQPSHMLSPRWSTVQLAVESRLKLPRGCCSWVQVCGTTRDRKRARFRVFPQTKYGTSLQLSVWGNGGQGHPQLRSLGHFDVDGCSGGRSRSGCLG